MAFNMMDADRWQLASGAAVLVLVHYVFRWFNEPVRIARFTVEQLHGTL